MSVSWVKCHVLEPPESLDAEPTELEAEPNLHRPSSGVLEIEDEYIQPAA